VSRGNPEVQNIRTTDSREQRVAKNKESRIQKAVHQLRENPSADESMSHIEETTSQEKILRRHL
jgi:hypothetical protein